SIHGSVLRKLRCDALLVRAEPDPWEGPFENDFPTPYVHDQRRQDGGVGGRLDPRRPSSPKEIRFPGRRGLGCPGGESVHLDPLLRRAGRVRSKGLRVLRLLDRKSTRLNSSHVSISYAVFCLKKKNSHNTIRKL